MLDRFKLGARVISSFILAAVLVVAVGGLGYYTALQGQASDTIPIVTAAAAIVILIWGVLLARSITSPLNLIVQMSQELGQRHFGMRLTINRHDEIGLAATALNQLANNLQREVVSLMKKVAAGDLNVEVQPRDSQDEIILAMKSTVKSLRGLLTETDRLSRSFAEGTLTARANPDVFPGVYKLMIQQTNQTLDSVTGPIGVVRQYASQLATGDASLQLPEPGQDSWAALRNDLNACAHAIQTLTADTIILSQAAVEGHPATRVDATRYSGNFRLIAQNMNSMMEGLVAPLNKSAECLATLAAGDVPPAITGAFKGDYEAIRCSLNTIIETTRLREADGQLLLEAASSMRWDTRADTSKYSGASGSLVDTMNQMMNVLTQSPSAIAERIASMARGEIPAAITETSTGDWARLKNDVNTCMDTMQALVADISRLSKSAAEGQLTTRADASRYRGEFRKAVENTNAILDAAYDSLKSASVYAGRIAMGDIPPDIAEGWQGNWIELGNNLRDYAHAINAFAADVEMLSGATTEGRLTVRADASRHQGRFREVIQVANDAMDAQMMSFNDINRVLTQLAQGNLTAQTRARYPGDLASIKTDLGAVADGLRAMAFKAQQASFGMSAATAQILASSSQMAITAQQQANTVIQVTNTVHETKASTEQSVRQAQEMAQVISELASVVEASAQVAGQIVTGVEQETARLDQVATDMDDINQTVQTALETAQQWQEIGQNLMTLSEQLKLTTAHYRL